MSKTMNPVTVTATATATVLLGKIGRLTSLQEVVVDKKNPFIGYFQKALQTPSTTTTTTSQQVSLPPIPLDRQTLQRFEWFKNQPKKCPPRVPFEASRPRATTTDTRRLPGRPILMASTPLPQVSDLIHSRYKTQFKEIRVLGRGGQGKVFEVESFLDKKKYAVKKINVPADGNRMKQALREVQVMAHLPPHRNVVHYFDSWLEDEDDIPLAKDVVEDEEASTFESSCGSFEPSYSCGIEFESLSNDDANNDSQLTMDKSAPKSKAAQVNKTLYIQMKLCEQVRNLSKVNNLTTWLRLTGPDRVKSSSLHVMAMRYFRDIVRGVQHLHTWGIIHRDIKPDNVFLLNGVAKVGDFGLATSVHDGANVMSSPEEPPASASHTTAIGTFLYASPEQVGSSGQAKTTYSEKSDIFGLGLILLELCCHFSTAMERVQVLTGARHGVLPTTTGYPAEMALVSSMTSLDPLDRPSAEQVLWLLSPRHQAVSTPSASSFITPMFAM